MENLRRATVADAAELTRLRGLVLAAMGEDVTARGWAAACHAAFARRLAETDRFAAYVVEQQGRLVAGGVGWVDAHLPSPAVPDGRRGTIASMVTEAGSRRQGHAGRVLDALLAWFAALGVRRVDLRATDDGRALYEARGFRPYGGQALTWTVSPPSR